MSGLFNFTRLKVRPIILLATALVVAITINASYINTATAAPEPFDNNTNRQVNRFLLGRALWSCLAKSNPSTMTHAELTTGQWTMGNSDANTSVGPFRVNNDMQLCDDYNGSGSATALVSPALSTLGINGDANKIAFACWLKSTDGTSPTRTNGSCTDGSGDFNMPGSTRFNDFVFATHTHSDESASDTPLTNLTPSQRYSLSMMALTKSCGATRAPGINSGGGAAGLNTGGGTEGFDHVMNIQEIIYSGGSATIVTTPYQMPDNIDKDTEINLFMTTNGNPYKIRCGDLENNSGHEYSTGANSAAYAIANNEYHTSIGHVPADGTALGEGGTAEDGDDSTSCLITGVGWLVCPVMEFLGTITDSSYGIIKKMLETSPRMFAQDNDPSGAGAATHQAWSMMRNISNIIFVIAFLFILYSQLTSFGISNYGVKKMLPRLIIAAILVNLSFYICALAVDISNVVGSNLKEMIDGAASQITTTTPDGSDMANWHNSSSVWSSLVTTVIAGTVLAVAGLTILLPMLIAVAVAVFTVVVVLSLRQALIILLVIISPLAFVALILPNTESWFKKWRSFFTVLLAMFPVIALIFGASAMAGKIVMLSANGDILIQIVGAGITIIPLFITPIIMKTAGGILNRFAGVVNNPSKGAFDRMKKGATGYRKNRQGLRKLRALSGGPSLPGGRGVVRGKVRRQAALDNRERELKRASSKYVSEEAIDNERFQRQLAAGGGEGAVQRALDQALNIQATIEAEEVKAASNRIERLVLNKDELRKVAGGEAAKGVDGSDLATRTAAFQQLTARGDFEGMNATWDKVRAETGGNAQQIQKAYADALAASGNRPAWIGQGALQSMREGDASKISDSQSLVEQSIKNNAYSAEKISTTDKDELQIVAEVNHTSNNINVADKVRLMRNAETALTDDELKTKVSKNIDQVTAISTASAPPSP